MQIATVSKLKTSLSAFLRRVKAGETIVVLDRGRPVARLVPVAEPIHDDAHLARLEALGLARRPSQGLPLDLIRARPKAEARVLEALLEERNEGR